MLQQWPQWYNDSGSLPGRSVAAGGFNQCLEAGLMDCNWHADCYHCKREPISSLDSYCPCLLCVPLAHFGRKAVLYIERIHKSWSRVPQLRIACYFHLWLNGMAQNLKATWGVPFPGIQYIIPQIPYSTE